MLAAHAIGQSILDIGYAQLPNRFLRQPGRTLTGIDLSEPKQPCGYDVHLTGDIFSLRELDGGRLYDSVIAGEFIEHVERPYDLLRYLRESLKPGGYLIISTPNPASVPVIFLEWTLYKKRFYTDDHVYYFNPRWVLRMLERTGYQLRKVRGAGLWPLALPCPVGLSYQVVYVAQRL